MPLIPGAEPFAHDGGPVGALVVHGFTGSPKSMRPWADELAAAGLTVRLPRLPGHGSTWQDMALTRWDDWYAEVDSALTDLAGRCSDVFVLGLSMGGSLSLRLAELRGDAVRGLVLVNPSVHSENKALVALPLLKSVVPSLKGIGNDIAKPGQDEGCYDRVPLKALHSLTQGWAAVKADIAKVDQPLLLFRSSQDHVVEPSNAAWILSHVRSTDLTERVLPNSYHVATLDNDAPEIFAGSLEFVRRLAPAAADT
ncbi:MAG: alpha/beta hydrolase [Actinomycetes bacterium]